jgi:putative ABC transport system permease protein
MKFAKNLSLSAEILAANKLRTFLSVIGMVVGIASVILMVAAGQGAQKKILDRIRNMGTNLIVVNAGQTQIIAGRQRQMGTVTTLVPADAEAIAEECPSVVSVAPFVSKKLTIRWEDETANTNVIGMAASGFAIRNFAPAKGEFFTDEESRALKRLAVVGPTVVKNLFVETDPIGLSIRLGRVPFQVVGVLTSKGIDQNGADQDDIIIVPIGTAMRRLLNVPYIQTIYVQAKDSRLMSKAESEIRDLLRARHRLRKKPDDFTIQNQETLLATERETSQSMTVLVGSVAGISLFVGGVGILAVMLISIRERRGEIGLRRALGARRQDIRLQFLFESILLAGSGGAMGVIIGVGCAYGLSALGYWDTLISWPATAVAFLLSMILGVFFGIYPASRAASLEPIEALRAE